MNDIKVTDKRQFDSRGDLKEDLPEEKTEEKPISNLKKQMAAKKEKKKKKVKCPVCNVFRPFETYLFNAPIGCLICQVCGVVFAEPTFIRDAIAMANRQRMNIVPVTVSMPSGKDK